MRAYGSVDFAHTPYADDRRKLKAIFIADACEAQGLGSDAAAVLPEDRRRDIARRGGQRPPSGETWALAVAELRRREGEPA